MASTQSFNEQQLRIAAQLALAERSTAMDAENQQLVTLLQKSIELANRRKLLSDLEQANVEPERIRLAKRVVEDAFYAWADARDELMITQKVVNAIREKANYAVADYKNARPKKRLAGDAMQTKTNEADALYKNTRSKKRFAIDINAAN